MLVRNNLETTNKAYLKQSQTAKEKKDISLGQKLNDTQKAAELTLSAKTKQSDEVKNVAAENILAAKSDMMSVAKADEMIRQANINILKQADDSMKVQSGQTAAAAIELLK